MKSYIGDYGIKINSDELKIVKEYNDSLMMTPEYAEKLGRTVRETNEILRTAPESIKPYLESLDGLEAQYKQVGDSAILGGSGIKKFGQIVKLTAIEIKAMAAQFLIFFAITEGISFLIKKFEELWATVRTENHVKTWAEEATSALEDTQEEIKSLNDELKATQDRINELQSKGSLSFVEQEELKRLQTQTALLERQLAVKRAIEENEKRKQSETNLAALKTYDNGLVYDDSSATPTYSLDSGSLSDQITAYTAALEDAKQRQLELNEFDTKEYEKKFKEYQDQIDKYDEKLINLINDASKFRDNIDLSLLNEEDIKYVEEYDKAVNQYLVKTGSLSPIDYIESSLSTSEFVKFNKQMQEMAKTGKTSVEEVRNAFSRNFPEVKQIMLDLGYTEEDWADNLSEHIKTLATIPEVLNNIFSGGRFADAKSSLDEILSDENFEIDTTSITEALGQDFVKILEKSGVSIKQFCEYLSLMQESLDSISIKDATEELSTIESTLNSLSDAYAEFRDNDGKVSSSTLDGLTESFASLEDTDALDNLINVLSDASSSVAEVESAMDRLVDSYLNQETALGNLNEQNKQLYINQLKQMGVSNAVALVEYKLAKATLENASATDEAKQSAIEMAAKVYDNVTALDSEAMAALDASTKLEMFASYQDYAAGNNFADVVNGHATALLNVATAAGESATNLARYVTIIGQLAELENVIVSTKASGKFDKGNASQIKKRELLAELNKIAGAAETEYGNLFKQNTTYTPSYEPKKDSGGDKKTAAERRKEEYDKQKAALDHQLEMNKISYAKYYEELKKLGKKYLVDQKGNLEDEREFWKDLSDSRVNAYEEAQAKIDKKLEDGKISIKNYYKQSNKIAKKWLDGRKSTEEDFADAVEKIYDQVLNAWDEKISKQEKQIERMTLDRNWEPGKTEADYWNKMLKDLKSDYLAGAFKSTDEYYDRRYELLEKLQDAEKEAWETQLDSIQDASDSINDLIDLVSDMMKQELEDQIDALETQRDLYDEILDNKLKSLQADKDAADYAKEIADLNKDLTDLQAKAAVLALDDSREGKAKYASVLEEIRQKQEEIQSSQSTHTYDATTDALEAARSAYEEKINSQVDSINKMMEEAGPWLERVYERIEQTPPSTLLAQLTKYNYYHGTGMDKDVQKIWGGSKALLNSFDSNIVKILAYLETQEKNLQSQIDSNEGSGPNLSENYESGLSKKIQATVTRGNSDATNMGLLDDVRAKYGSGWYDTTKKVIYLGEDGDRRVSAGAADIIQQMEAIKNSSKSKAKKKKALDALLEKLKKKWGYKDAHLVWSGDIPHLYKTAGKSDKWQIFHTGIKQGFVSGGSTYTPVTAKQNEVLALLQKGELVFNKSDEYDLLRKLQVLDTLTTSLKKMQLDGINQITNTSGDIYVTVEAPINVTGATNDEMMRQLDKFRRNLKDDTLTAVTDSLKKRGYKNPANGLRSK